jgi:hypothetical protein
VIADVARSAGYAVPPPSIHVYIYICMYVCMYRIKKEKVQSTSSENRRADGARDEDTKIYLQRVDGG